MDIELKPNKKADLEEILIEIDRLKSSLEKSSFFEARQHKAKIERLLTNFGFKITDQIENIVIDPIKLAELKSQLNSQPTQQIVDQVTNEEKGTDSTANTGIKAIPTSRIKSGPLSKLKDDLIGEVKEEVTKSLTDKLKTQFSGLVKKLPDLLKTVSNNISSTASSALTGIKPALANVGRSIVSVGSQALSGLGSAATTTATVSVTIGGATIPIWVVVVVGIILVALFFGAIILGYLIVSQTQPAGGEAGGGGSSGFGCLQAGAPAPPQPDLILSPDSQYAYPLPDYNNSNACYHWKEVRAIDIFTAGGENSDPLYLPVVAYTSGTITNVTPNDPLGGNYFILSGNDGRYYYYAHNCAIYKSAGDSVSVGEVIASSNQTGLNAEITPEHLHFAINSNSDVFPSGGGDVCPFTDIREKFGIASCALPLLECAPSWVVKAYYAGQELLP